VLVRSLVAAGAVVVVVVAGAVTTGILRTNVWGPAPTVRSYVDAISRGDARAAAAMSDTPDGNTAMLGAAVLASAKDRPRNVTVGTVRAVGDSASATVTYTQGGKNRTGTVELRRTGTSFLVKDDWRVVTPLASRVTITAASGLEGAPVRVGGKRVGTIRDNAFTSTAYPGTYAVTVGGTKYFTGGTEKVTIGASSYASANFAPKATKQLTKDAEALVTDQITACAKSTKPSPGRGCPFYGPYDAKGAVTYTIAAMPKLSVEVSGSGSVFVQSTEDGTVEYDYESYFDGTQHSEDTFDVYTYMSIKGGKLVADSF
jgi:hypothetical protein